MPCCCFQTSGQTIAPVHHKKVHFNKHQKYALSSSLSPGNPRNGNCPRTCTGQVTLLVRLLPLRSRPPLPVYRNHSPSSLSSSYLGQLQARCEMLLCMILEEATYAQDYTSLCVCPGLMCSTGLATLSAQLWVVKTSLLSGLQNQSEAYPTPT